MSDFETFLRLRSVIDSIIPNPRSVMSAPALIEKYNYIRDRISQSVPEDLQEEFMALNPVIVATARRPDDVLEMAEDEGRVMTGLLSIRGWLNGQIEAERSRPN